MTQSPATSLPSPKERRRLREAKSLTRAELAATLGVSPETVRLWESGRMHPQGHEGRTYAKLLTALATTPKRPARPTERAERAGPRSELRTHLGPSSPHYAGGHSNPAGSTAPVRPSRTSETSETSEASEASKAFDALCDRAAPTLVRQAFLLTGRRSLAQESVERAFQQAWQRWPEVAVDRDPAGWVRAAVHEYAMSPWHRFRPGLRHPDAPPADSADRALFHVLLSLPPVQRRALLLYDGVGLDLPDTAAEMEASTPATAYRLTHAREAVAAALPELADPEELHRRLAELGATERLRPPGAESLRVRSEHRTRVGTRTAIAFTALIVGATTLTLHTAPTHYEAPLSPGRAINGVPPHMGPSPLTDRSRALHTYLDAQLSKGPGHLTPDLR
ncbi:sigma factor-like helix-turn-helix DNA-binding protein [Streptomyces sp. DSM 118878]